MEPLIITTKNDLKKILKDAMIEIDYEKYCSLEGQKTYSINGVAKRLNMAHNTIKKYVLAGVIKSTSSGRITEQAINEYLAGK
ncbi:MAG: helix-turn-helix domain-containing protein [Lentimicrobium sp.]|nr:helix-turn-helix domain-containing protein [Lentimicrobium sp.]